MVDISNRTVVALLAVALMVTVVGTLLSVSRLQDIGATGLAHGALTGAATSGTGTTTLTIDYEAGISVDDSVVSFGTGHVVVGGYTNASVHSTGVFNATTWYNTSGLPHINASAVNVKFDNTSARANNSVGDYMVVSNNGNVDINVTVYPYSNASAEVWLCGSSCASTAVAMLLVQMYPNESNSCDNGNIPPGNYHNNQSNNTWQELLTTSGRNNITLCQDLDYGDSGDALNVFYQAYVPFDATAEAHAVVLTFEATSRSKQD